MSMIARTDRSLLTRWWWTVDRWNLMAIATLAAVGATLALAASPPVAARLGLDTFHFAERQAAFLALGLAAMIFVSLLSPLGVRRLAFATVAGGLALMVAVLLVGPEVKGATRWLHLGGITLQPSEFIKPGLAVASAWLFAEALKRPEFPGRSVACALFAVTAMLLLLQPDVGMTMVVGSVFAVQFFLAGLPVIFVFVVGFLFLGGSVAAYFTFDHVQRRVDRFMDPNAEGFQVGRSLDAFRNGGLTGRGPGEGRVKEQLPDAHTDFIFAVAGEEFGLMVCLAIVGLFAFIVMRGLGRAFRSGEMFVLLAAAGLLFQFAAQVIVNLASTLHLIPPKGMTLPFISYGGSSVLATGIGLGMVLALTRERGETSSGEGKP